MPKPPYGSRDSGPAVRFLFSTGTLYNPPPAPRCLSGTLFGYAVMPMVKRKQESALVEEAVCAPEWTELLRKMILIRRFEEASEREFRKGKIGGYLHVYIGQEGIAAGILSAALVTHLLAVRQQRTDFRRRARTPADSVAP